MLREDKKVYFRNSEKIYTRRPKAKLKEELVIKREMERLYTQIGYMRQQLECQSTREDEKKFLVLRLDKLSAEYDECKRLLQEKSNWNKPQRRFRLKYRRIKPEKAYTLIVQKINRIKKDDKIRWKVITKEETSKEFHIREYQVEQVFHRLNLEGILSQAIHSYPHDNNRNPWDGGGFSGWQSDYYEILER